MSKPLLTAHPLAEVFPLMHGREFDALVASIKDGLKEPITLFEGMILDGRNRYRACLEAGVEPRFVEFTGADPRKFVIEKNVNRRHMTTGQRAMAAAKLATAERGRPQINGSNLAPLSIPEAAKLLSVSEHSVKYAKTVLAKGTADLQKGVQDRKISVSAAAKIVDLPEEKQAEQVAKYSEAVTKESRDKRPPRFKSKRATSAANSLESLCEVTYEIKSAAFVKDCPPERREYVAEWVDTLKVWLHGVEVAQDAADAAKLESLDPASLAAMVSKMSSEDREAVMKAVAARVAAERGPMIR